MGTGSAPLVRSRLVPSRLDSRALSIACSLARSVVSRLSSVADFWCGGVSARSRSFMPATSANSRRQEPCWVCATRRLCCRFSAMTDRWRFAPRRSPPHFSARCTSRPAAASCCSSRCVRFFRDSDCCFRRLRVYAGDPRRRYVVHARFRDRSAASLLSICCLFFFRRGSEIMVFLPNAVVVLASGAFVRAWTLRLGWCWWFFCLRTGECCHNLSALSPFIF